MNQVSERSVPLVSELRLPVAAIRVPQGELEGCIPVWIHSQPLVLRTIVLLRILKLHQLNRSFNGL